VARLVALRSSNVSQSDILTGSKEFVDIGSVEMHSHGGYGVLRRCRYQHD